MTRHSSCWHILRWLLKRDALEITVISLCIIYQERPWRLTERAQSYIIHFFSHYDRSLSHSTLGASEGSLPQLSQNSSALGDDASHSDHLTQHLLLQFSKLVFDRDLADPHKELSLYHFIRRVDGDRCSVSHIIQKWKYVFRTLEKPLG